MKKKTWLFIIVLIVFIINISFFVLVRLAKVDKIVQSKISNQLSDILNADIKMEEFTFNDKQANISGIEINETGKFNLKVNQLYIEYDLLKLIFSKFKNLKAITHIKIYDPEFSIQIKPDGNKKEKSKFIIPDITEYFKMLDIYNGKFNLEFDNKVIKITNSWEKINLAVKNNNSSDITLSAISGEGSNLKASCILNKGSLIKADLKLNDLKPSKVEISQLKSLGFAIDADLHYFDKKLNYISNLKNVNAELAGKKASIDSIFISGKNKRTFITLHNSYLDGNKIEGSANIYDILSNNRTINSELTISNVSLHKYIEQVNGNLNANINISGKVTKPVINAKFTSNKLTVAKQELKDINVAAIMKDGNIELNLKKSIWEENLLIGDGYYKIREGLHLNFHSKNMLWQKGKLQIMGDLSSVIDYQNIPKIFIKLDNINIKSGLFEFDDLTLKANLTGDDFIADVTHSLKNIGFSCFGNIRSQELKAKLKLRGLDLNQVLNESSLPILTGNIEVDANKYSIVTNSNIMVYDRDYGKLGGRFKTNIKLDLSKKHSLINLQSYNARYNYEPFKIDLLAEGSLDSLQINYLKLNQMINIKGWLKQKPEFNYKLSIQGDNIKIKEFSKYLLDYYTSQQLDGNFSIDVNVDNLEEGSIDGLITVDNFKTSSMKELDAKLKLVGNSSKINIRDSFIKTNEHKIIDLQGALTIHPEISITANGIIDSLQLADILQKENLNGIVKGGIEFSRSQNNNEFQMDFEVKQFKLNKFRADLLKFDILQNDSLLYVNEIKCYRKDEFNLRSNGAIGFNILNSKAFSDTNYLSIKFDGDLIKMLSNQTNAIISGGADAEFEFKIGTRDCKIFIEKGNFSLTKGYMKINDQPEDIDKLTFKFEIINNIFQIDKFQFRMGEGRCRIFNEITNDNEDFILGTLNIGKILIDTNDGGVLFNMPGYIPENNVVKIVISGRDNEYFEVRGPFEDVHLIGDLNISNGGVIFPPNTENLLKLFNTVREKKDSGNVTLPLSFDLMINFGENMKYVTYPVDIKLNQGGYLNLIYENEKFTIADALFIAEEGSVDIFGTEMKLDYLQIQLSKFTEGTNISGTFYKKTADGSLITLNIYNEITGNDEVGTLKFSLLSDNANDRITDILSKLRYNRSMEDISPDQKKTLLQDEVIQIAGMGLESAVMDPLLSPLENWVRKTLKLDYFHIRTDLVQNLFASYSSDEKSQYEIYDETNELTRLSSELFLNNLSISMGRYLSRDLFLDYETRVERSQDVALASEMGVFHEFSLRYQLPYKFRILYKYKILPFKEENPHEIMLEKSFKF